MPRPEVLHRRSPPGFLGPEDRAHYHLVAHDTWEPWMRAGDRALVSLHQSWGLKLAKFWDAVAAMRATIPLAVFPVAFFAGLSSTLIGATFWSIGCAWASTGRVVDGPCTHIGVRPTDLAMVNDEAPEARGVSVRVTTDWPVCPRSR